MESPANARVSAYRESHSTALGAGAVRRQHHFSRCSGRLPLSEQGQRRRVNELRGMVDGSRESMGYKALGVVPIALCDRCAVSRLYL